MNKLINIVKLTLLVSSLCLSNNVMAEKDERYKCMYKLHQNDGCTDTTPGIGKNTIVVDNVETAFSQCEGIANSSASEGGYKYFRYKLEKAKEYSPCLRSTHQ